MNSGNAFGFLFLSVVMMVAPVLAPSWFPPSGFDGTNGRALWLMVMGLVQGGLATTFLVSHWVVPAVQRVAEYRLRTRRGDAMLPQGAAQSSVI